MINMRPELVRGGGVDGDAGADAKLYMDAVCLALNSFSHHSVAQGLQ